MKNWHKMGFEKTFLLWKFLFWLTTIEFHLGETSNQLICNESCQLLLQIFFFGFYKFDFKLHNARQVTIVSSAWCIIVTGMVPFKILKNFIWLIVLSTWIRKFSSSFVFLTSGSVIWLFTLAPGGTTNLQKWRIKSS